MYILCIILFFVSSFIIFWGMIGYSTSLKVISKIFKTKKNFKDYNNTPGVTLMVVAHNEEKVIHEKLNNIINIDYPKEKIDYLIVSDNSTDNTNEIVEEFIKQNSQEKIKLFKVKERKGKTNAQNEAARTVTSEILVMTDANSIIKPDAIRELVSSFTDNDIVYVTGALKIANQDLTDSSNSENTYWESDLFLREIESDIKTITAGNGALYACRTKFYVEFDPIECHDSAMPLYYALDNKRAICNHNAIAYEKAGEVFEDEFKRKVRMNRIILTHILPSLKILNIIKYGWFSYFYFGHRTCRYLLWISHLLVLISSGILALHFWFFGIVFLLQTIFYFIAILKYVFKMNNKIFNLVFYYTMTICAQWVGVYKIITKQSKPFWEKAETTR